MALANVSQAPIAPDFSFCSSFYGATSLKGFQRAYEMMRSDFPKYELTPAHLPSAWPWPSDPEDTSEIHIDLVIPSASEHEPSVLRQNNLLPLAGWIVNECIQKRREGGFAVQGIANMISYLRNTNEQWWEEGYVYPDESMFFTVAASDRDWGFNAGYLDPMVGGKLFTSLHRELVKLPRNSPDFARLDNTANRIGYHYSFMRRSDEYSHAGGAPWYR